MGTHLDHLEIVVFSIGC